MFRSTQNIKVNFYIPIFIVSGNLKLLSLDDSKIYNRYLCQEHFSPDSFMNAANMTKLKPTAIPYKFNDNEKPSTSSGVLNDNIIDYILTKFNLFILLIFMNYQGHLLIQITVTLLEIFFSKTNF